MAEAKKPLLDLSGPEGDKMVVVSSAWCLYCKRKTNVLKLFSMCQICISFRLTAGKFEIRTPPDYVEKQKMEVCAICLEQMRLGQLVTSCCQCIGHFHNSCLAEWGKRSGKKECPMCRHPLQTGI